MSVSALASLGGVSGWVSSIRASFRLRRVVAWSGDGQVRGGERSVDNAAWPFGAVSVVVCRSAGDADFVNGSIGVVAGRSADDADFVSGCACRATEVVTGRGPCSAAAGCGALNGTPDDSTVDLTVARGSLNVATGGGAACSSSLSP